MNRRTVSGIMLTLVLIGMLTLAFNIQQVKASGTVYIRADGSIYPSTANITSVDNVTYTFTDNIYDEIVVERSNITVDGNGYTLQGSGMQHTASGNGFFIYWKSNVTIKNTNIREFRAGIQLDNSLNNTISGNNITRNYIGILLEGYSNYNTISGNRMTRNAAGIQLYKSSNNHVSGNSMTANDCNGIYLKESSNYNSISGNNITANTYRGIYLEDYCDYNSISGNNITANKQEGILLIFDSKYNSIYENTITNNGMNVWDEGIALSLLSDNNIILRNNITNNICGIRASTDNNIISGNNIAGNSEYGIIFSNNNIVLGNNITNNAVGIRIGSNSCIYHNNFINNTKQVNASVYASANTWDDGYPSGGNYWSDYEERYPNAVELDSSGIWDTSYVICENFTDRYPLVNPYADTVPPTISILSPENKSYSLDGVPLTFTVSESTLWIGYSLDDQENQTITGNWILSVLSEGPHSMIVYAEDNVGNTGASEMVYFTIETQQEEPFPTWIIAVIVIIAVFGVTLLVYFTKVKKTT